MNILTRLALITLAAITLTTSSHASSPLSHIWTSSFPPSTSSMPVIRSLYRYGNTIGVLGVVDTQVVANYAANASDPSPTWTLKTPPFPTVLAGGDNSVGYVFTNGTSCSLSEFNLPGSSSTPTWTYACPDGVEGAAGLSGNGEVALLVTTSPSGSMRASVFAPNSNGVPSVNVSLAEAKLPSVVPELISFEASGPNMFVAGGDHYAIVSSFTGAIRRHGSPNGDQIVGVCNAGKYILTSASSASVLVWADRKYSSVLSLPRGSLPVISSDCSTLATYQPFGDKDSVLDIYALNGVSSARLLASLTLSGPIMDPPVISPSAVAIACATENTLNVIQAPFSSSSSPISASVPDIDGRRVSVFEPPSPNGIAAYIFASGYSFSSSVYQISYFHLDA